MFSAGKKAGQFRPETVLSRREIMRNENRERESRRENPGRSQQPSGGGSSQGEGKSSSGSGSSEHSGSGSGMSREEIRKKRSGGLGSHDESQESEE
jgi:hypothetical protein